MGAKQSKKTLDRNKRHLGPVNPAECPVVQTRLGAVKGKTTYTRQGSQPVYNYLGVPYAAPPTGIGRFQPPQTPKSWSMVKDVTQPGSPCIQNLSQTAQSFYPVPIPSHKPSEDCLYLNVYTTKVGLDAKRPVMVWIHGGSFNKGMAQLYDGTAYAMYGDVVVVTINYRLGVFGFLSTEDSVCPGNYGLLDQIAALTWVHQHIDQFGGDPNNVTVFGESAGALSSQYLMLSPLARGLFHKVICQSGSAGVRAGFSHNSRERALMLARLMGCTSTNSRSVVSFLRQQPADQLLEAQDKLQAKGITFLLTVDKSFMTSPPLDLYASGLFQRIPMLIGINSHEGYYFCERQCPGFEADNITEDKILHFLHRSFSTIFPGGEDRVLDVVRREYFPEALRAQRSRDLVLLRKTCAEAFGDLFMSAAVYQSAELHCTAAPTYFYVDAHKPLFSRHPSYITGPTHEEELLLAWGDPWMDRPVNEVISYSQDENKLSLNLIKYWTNFAKIGNPNSTDLMTWPMFDYDEARYLEITIQPKIVSNYRPHRMKLWNQIVPDMLNTMKNNGHY